MGAYSRLCVLSCFFSGDVFFVESVVWMFSGCLLLF